MGHTRWVDSTSESKLIQQPVLVARFQCGVTYSWFKSDIIRPNVEKYDLQELSARNKNMGTLPLAMSPPSC